ncbi:cryptococcal mannosyltransferase 1-domain-containing protein [Neofusicoccum parvum]|nr:cryptococcal mannosyltransferase 1-domain-containing protein [Neofusicoccum parvum]
MLRSNWNQAVLDLVNYLGAENVFVAILEGGSWDGSKAALQELDAELQQTRVPRSFIFDNVTHKDATEQIPAVGEEGWIWTPRGRRELRRIPYLAKLRNRVMEEMRRASGADSRPFTKVLWLNDVVFTTSDALTLLSTNGGDYAAACSLDFAKPPAYYDTFALRDTMGRKSLTQTWPYFYSSATRNAVVSNPAAVPVQSCWNGMVAMDAAPFTAPGRPLQFRSIADQLATLHLEGSECCLVHADNPLSASKGVWLNANVRVAYGAAAYAAVNLPPRHVWPPPTERVIGMWHNRLARLLGWIRASIEGWVVQRRLQSWMAEDPAAGGLNKEPGVHCLINEMQVLVENGWKHL